MDADGDLVRESPGAPAPFAIGRAQDALAIVVLGGLAFALRALTWPAVLTPEGVRLVGPDAHYHLRRILWSVENFPATLRHDPYLRFPDGAEAIWPPAFDWSIAALARLAGARDPHAVEALAVWVPPLLGALTVCIVYALARRAFDRRTALLAAGVSCVLPAHVSYSQVGFVDHHAAVAAMAAVGIAATLALLRQGAGGGFGPAVALGLWMGAALLLWPGALLHVATAGACVLGWLLAAPDASEARRRVDRATVAPGVAFLLVAPFTIDRGSAVWGALSPVVLSGFQPLVLGLATGVLGGCALAWRHAGLASRRARLASLAAGLALPTAAALLVPELRQGAREAATWLLRDEPFQSLVAESLPLFSDGQGFSVRRAHRQLTPLVWIVPVLVAALWRAPGTPQRRTAQRVVALWCAVLFAATLVQYRFANSLSLAFALALGCTLEPVLGALAGRAAAVRRGALAAAVLAGAVLLVPIARSHATALGTAARTVAGEEVRAPERVAHQQALGDAARWLRDHSPTTAGWLERDARPAYGVLTAWGDGHVMRYLARRPVVQDNFGDDVGRERFEQAEAYYAAASEREALAIARALRVRYVLVRASGSGHAPAPYASDSQLVRLQRLRGAAGGLRTPGGERPVFVPALARHRLLYESSPASDEDSGRYKIFEIVEGARVEGRARPGAIVEARLPLEDENGAAAFEYRAHARAGPDGRYALRLPYPTEPFTGRFRAASPYRLQSGQRAGALALSEAEVRDGARREGPDLAG